MMVSGNEQSWKIAYIQLQEFDFERASRRSIHERVTFLARVFLIAPPSPDLWTGTVGRATK